jgi:hypothetical protein
MDASIGQVTRWKMEEGLRMSLESGLRLPSPWVPVESVCTCPRHKENQLYAVYVRWTSKLSLLSLFATVNKNIYRQKN